MAETPYPMAARYPAAEAWLTGVAPPPLALLSPKLQRQMLADIETMMRLTAACWAAQQIISQIDLEALNLAYETLAAADLLGTLYGGSEEWAAWQQAYMQTMHDLVTQAHAQVLGYLKGESTW